MVLVFCGELLWNSYVNSDARRVEGFEFRGIRGDVSVGKKLC